MRSMLSIGFDLEDRGSHRPVTTVAVLLAQLQDELDNRGATSRHLHFVAFDPEGAKIEINLRPSPLSPGYPDLSLVFGQIARTCAEDRIDVHQLRRIAFAEEAISFQLVDDSGRPEVYLYPIHAADAV
jgi:hypothetical protein